MLRPRAIELYFYPRPPGGGRRRGAGGEKKKRGISIHALRVEGDNLVADRNVAVQNFYPRPPGGGRPFPKHLSLSILFDFYPRPPGGGRLDLREPIAAPEIFLSTPSGWRATYCFAAAAGRRFHFYPRPPGGGRHWCLEAFSDNSWISIHALRVEGDLL